MTQDFNEQFINPELGDIQQPLAGTSETSLFGLDSLNKADKTAFEEELSTSTDKQAKEVFNSLTPIPEETKTPSYVVDGKVYEELPKAAVDKMYEEKLPDPPTEEAKRLKKEEIKARMDEQKADLNMTADELIKSGKLKKHRKDKWIKRETEVIDFNGEREFSDFMKGQGLEYRKKSDVEKETLNLTNKTNNDIQSITDRIQYNLSGIDMSKYTQSTGVVYSPEFEIENKKTVDKGIKNIQAFQEAYASGKIEDGSIFRAYNTYGYATDIKTESSVGVYLQATKDDNGNKVIKFLSKATVNPLTGEPSLEAPVKNVSEVVVDPELDAYINYDQRIANINEDYKDKKIDEATYNQRVARTNQYKTTVSKENDGAFNDLMNDPSIPKEVKIIAAASYDSENFAKNVSELSKSKESKKVGLVEFLMNKITVGAAVSGLGAMEKGVGKVLESAGAQEDVKMPHGTLPLAIKRNPAMVQSIVKVIKGMGDKAPQYLSTREGISDIMSLVNLEQENVGMSLVTETAKSVLPEITNAVKIYTSTAEDTRALYANHNNTLASMMERSGYNTALKAVNDAVGELENNDDVNVRNAYRFITLQAKLLDTESPSTFTERYAEMTEEERNFVVTVGKDLQLNKNKFLSTIYDKAKKIYELSQKARELFPEKEMKDYEAMNKPKLDQQMDLYKQQEGQIKGMFADPKIASLLKDMQNLQQSAEGSSYSDFYYFPTPTTDFSAKAKWLAEMNPGFGLAIGALGDLRNTISGAKETIYKLSGKNVDNLNLTEKNLAYSLKSFNDTLGTIETEDVLFNTAKGIGSAVAQLYSIGKAFTAFKAMGLGGQAGTYAYMFTTGVGRSMSEAAAAGLGPQGQMVYSLLDTKIQWVSEMLTGEANLFKGPLKKSILTKELVERVMAKKSRKDALKEIARTIYRVSGKTITDATLETVEEIFADAGTNLLDNFYNEQMGASFNPSMASVGQNMETFVSMLGASLIFKGAAFAGQEYQQRQQLRQSTEEMMKAGMTKSDAILMGQLATRTGIQDALNIMNDVYTGKIKRTEVNADVFARLEKLVPIAMDAKFANMPNLTMEQRTVAMDNMVKANDVAQMVERGEMDSQSAQNLLQTFNENTNKALKDPQFATQQFAINSTEMRGLIYQTFGLSENIGRDEFGGLDARSPEQLAAFKAAQMDMTPLDRDGFIGKLNEIYVQDEENAAIKRAVQNAIAKNPEEFLSIEIQSTKNLIEKAKLDFEIASQKAPAPLQQARIDDLTDRLNILENTKSRYLNSQQYATEISTGPQQEVGQPSNLIQPPGVEQGQQEVGQGEGGIGQPTQQTADARNRNFGSQEEQIAATAKALTRGYSKDEMVLRNKAEDLIPIDIKQKQISPSEKLSEAYVKAKADGSNPELVKAVEDLIGQPAAPMAEAAPVAEPEIAAAEKAFLDAFKGEQIEAVPVVEAATAMEAPTVTGPVEQQVISEAAPKRGRRRKIEAPAEEQKTTVTEQVKSAVAQEPTPLSEDAKGHATSLGGVAFEVRPGLGIVQGFNMFGKPIYAGFKGGSRTKVDIDSYTGTGFTSEELAELKALRQNIEATEAANQAQFGSPFDRQGRVAASDSVPDNVKGFVNELTANLGIGNNIFIITDSDFTKEQFDKHGLYGTLAQVRSALLSSRNPLEYGAKRFMSDANAYYIYYDSKLTDAQRFTTISHEIGHIVEQSQFNNASTETKNKINEDYQKWFANLSGKSLADVINETRDITIQELFEGNTGNFNPSQHRYISSFTEYFADNVAKWARTSEKPRGLVDTFFANLKDLFTKILDYVTRTGNYSKNIFEWLDGLYGTNVSGVNPDNEMLSAMAARPGKQGSAAQIKNLANLYMDRELKKGRSVDEAGVIARSNLTSFLLANVKDYATALQKAGIALDNVIEEAKQEAQAKQRQEALNKMFATPKVRSLVDAAQKTADDIVKANKGKKIGKTSPTQAYKNILSDLIKKINTMYARGNYPAGIPSVTLVKAASGIAQDAVNAAFPRAEKLSIQEAEMASMTTREYIRTMVANQINAIGKVKDRAKFIQKAVGEIIDTLKDSFGADFTLSSSALKQLNKSLFDAVFSRMDDTAAIDDIIAKVSPVVEYAMRKQMLSSTAKLLDKIRSNYDNGRYSGATRLSVRESLYDADARKWLNSNASLEDISLFNQYLKELTGRSVNTTNLNNAIQLADAFVPSPKVATTNKKDALNNKIKNLTRKIGTGAVYLADYKALVRLEKAISDIEQKKGDLTGLTQEEQDEIMNNYNDLLDTLPNPIEQLVEDAKAQIEAEAKSKVAALNEAIATSQEFRDSIKNPLLYEGVLRFAKELTDDFINSLPTKDKALLAENIDEIMNGNPNSITYEFSSKAGAFKQANINYKFGKDIFGKRQLIGENGLTGAFNKVRRAFMDVDYNRASAERMAASFDLFRFHLMDAELNTGVDEFGMGVLESSVFGPLAKAIDSAFNKVTEALGPLQESMKLLNDKSNRAAIKKGIGELNRELGTGFFGGKAAWMHMKKLLGYGNSFYMDISTRMATIVATQIDHISNLEEGESPVDVVLLRNILDVTPEQYDGRTMKEQYEGNPTSITGMTDDAQMFDHIAYGILTKGGVNKLSDLNKDELLALLTDSQRQAIAKWREHIDNNKYVVEAAMIMKGNVTAFLNEYFPRKVYSKEGVSEIKDIEEYLKSAGGNVGVDSGQLKSRKGEKGRLDLNGNAVLYNNLKDIYLIHEVKPTLDALKGLDDAVAKLKNEKDLGAATYAEAISIAMASRVKNALESNEKIANQDYSFWYKSVSKVTSAASRVILISQLRQAFADFPSNIAKLSASLGFANRTLKNQVLQVVSPTKSSYTTDKGEFVWDDYVKIALTTGSSVHRVMSVYADNFLYEFSKSKEQLQREQRVGSWQDMAVKKHAWMSRFEQAFERITGEALDHKAFEDERGAYRAMYYDSVQKASDVADSFIDRQYGLSSFARQPLRINVFAPFVGRFLRNVFGKSPTIAKNNPASVILGFLSGYPGVQHQLFSRYIRSALSTDRSMSKKQRAEDITRALTEVIAPSVMYNTIRATTGILFTTTAAAVMAAGDSEEDRKRLYKQMEEMPFWKRWFTKIRLAAGDGEEKLYNAVVNGMLSSAVDPNVNALIRPAIGFTIFKTWKENAIEEMTKKGNTKKEIAEAKQKIRDIESVWFETYGIRPIELFGTKEYAEGIKRYYPAGAATEGVEDLIKSTGGFGILYNEVSRLMDVNKLINATDENKNLSETEVYAAAGLKLAGLTFSNIILRGNAGAALSMFSGDMNKLSNMIISDQKSIQTGFEIKQKKKQSGKQKGSSRLRKRETRKRNRGR